MRGGSVEVWTKNILYRFIESQIHFGMPRGAKMSGTTQSQKDDHDTRGWLTKPTNKSLNTPRELELTNDKIVVIPQHVDVIHDFFVIDGILYKFTLLGALGQAILSYSRRPCKTPLRPFCGLDSTTWQQKAYVEQIERLFTQR